MNYNSDYDIRLKMLESLGGDVTRKYDSVYSIDLEILRLLEQGGGGGGVVIQNYKGLITNPNTELIKAGDLGYNEVLEPNVKYSKYFTFQPNARTLYLKIPSGISKTFLKVEKSGDFYNLCVNKLNEDGTYTWEHIQDNLQDLPELTKVPFTYIFYDETLSKNVEFPGEFAWSLERQEIYYTSTIDGWVPELKMKGAIEWNEGFYDISEPEVFTKKQKGFYVKDGDGNVINTNDINEKPKTNSSKIVRIGNDWYIDNNRYQTEIKKALDDIYNEVSNNRSVTVIFNGYSSQPGFLFQTTNVVSTSANYVQFSALGTDNWLLSLTLSYDEGSNHSRLDANETKLASESELYLPYVYTDGRINLNSNNGYVSEFISEPTVDNEEFVVLKTTVPSFKGTENMNRGYSAFNFLPWGSNYGDWGYTYYLSRFGGMKLVQDEYNSNYDLIPDGEWYVIFSDINAVTYEKLIVTKSVRNVDGSLDVYLGFKGINIDILLFWDCTIENPEEQGDYGRWNEKNWVKVSDSQRISVDSFIGRRTRYFCVNTEGTKVDRIVLFKRMK